MRFDEWMQRCLYGPDGFYVRGGRAGRGRGDFITSPEVGPLFGAVVARWLDATWRELGSPEPFVVAEAGAGRGALRISVAAAAPACAAALEYHAVEISPAIGGPLSQLDLPTRCHVVLANELLDNLPFRIVERTGSPSGGFAAAPGRWSEVLVDPSTHPTSFCLTNGTPGDAFRETERVLAQVDDVPIGTRLPWLERAEQWVEAARARAHRVLVFDYGVEQTVELVGRDWLRTYRDHRVGTDPLVEPGSCDITTDVAFDQLPAGARILRQGHWLERWGIEDLVDEGRRIWTERAHIGDLAAIRGRSRVTEAEALCEPSGLGGFLVAEWSA